MQILVPEFLVDIQIEPWTSGCAEAYAYIASGQRDSGRSISIFDMMIAAHALARDLTLVTHDKAFAQIPNLKIEDWTEEFKRP